MLYNIALWLSLGLSYGLIACVYAVILVEPSMLLNPLYNKLDNSIGNVAQKRALEAGKKARFFWLYKLLIGCPRCVAGQAGVWLTLLVVLTEPIKYSFFGHLFAVAVSIFSVNLFIKLYKWSRNI
jgi:hypothetical protein